MLWNYSSGSLRFHALPVLLHYMLTDVDRSWWPMLSVLRTLPTAIRCTKMCTYTELNSLKFFIFSNRRATFLNKYRKIIDNFWCGKNVNRRICNFYISNKTLLNYVSWINVGIFIFLINFSKKLRNFIKS